MCTQKLLLRLLSNVVGHMLASQMPSKNVKIAANSKACVQACISEMIGIISDTAKQVPEVMSSRKGRSTIGNEQIKEALNTLGVL